MRGSSRTRFVAVLVFTGTLVVGAAPPCFACSCVAATDEEHYQRADVVFTGKATERHDPSTGGPQGSADPIHWTFDVDGVQKGNADDPAVVETSRDEASCGVTFAIGRRYQVYATNTGEYLHTDLCSGTRELNASQGPYAPPAATPVPTAAPATPSPALTVAPTPSATPSPSPTASPSATPVAITPSPTLPDIAPARGEGPGAGAYVALVAAVLALAFATLWRRRSSSS